jgi:hypothetical protein
MATVNGTANNDIIYADRNDTVSGDAGDDTIYGGQGNNVTSYEFTNQPKLGTTSKGQDIFLGGFSGLYFQGIAANGNLKFVTNTDRGPNGEPTGANRPFYLPSFQPEIVSFELNQTSGEISITKRTGLFGADGKTALTGLPNLQASANGLAYTDEIGVDLDGKVLANDSLGADVEGIVVAPNGDYWLVDEYRPAIYHFDVNGKLLDRFIPKGTATAPVADLPAGTFGTEVLPEVYAQRRSNRGFEAVAIEGTKLYAFIQSPIDNPDNAGDTASRATRTLRILEFDTVTKAVTGEYLYLLDDVTGTGNAKTDKLGDAVSLGGGKFAVIERDDIATTASNKLIYQIDLAGATNINNPANFTLPVGKTIEQLTPAELTAAKITTVSKSLIANAAQLGYTGVEKVEGLALVAPNTLALINDNDFNVVAGSKVPSKLGILELSQELPITGSIVNRSISPTDPANLNLSSNDFYTKITGDNRANILDASTGGGNNQLFGGEGADELYAYQNDRLFGEGGNDILDATDGKGGNNLDGGMGNDTLFASAGDRLNGDDGDDILFAGDGGNTLTGGNGKDTFVLAVTTVPTTANIITDFKAGTDTLKIVGLPSIGDDLTKLTAIVQGNDTLLKAGTVDLAILKGIQANSIADVLNPNPNIAILPAPSTIGTKTQNLTQRVIDLTDYAGKALKIDIKTQGDAAYDNNIGFYAVEDSIGTIKLTSGGTLKPGDANYAVEAIKSAILRAGKIDSRLNQDITGGQIYAPVVVAQGSLTDFVSKNPRNGGDSNVIHAYFNYIGANPDQFDHFKLTGANTFAVEDQFGGGDRDFNDLVVSLNITAI